MNACQKMLSETFLGISMIALSSAVHPMPRLLWNASASVPIGLYLLQPPSVLRSDEMLVVRPPDALAHFMAARKYLAIGVPLIKHIAALPGHMVCRSGRTIIVDGIAEAEALDRDSRGQELPVWRGCHTVQSGEVFLMNASVLDSFDGRYFGSVPDSTIIGSATPLWIPREKLSRNLSR